MTHSIDLSTLTLRQAWLQLHQSADHSPRYAEDVLKALDHWERLTDDPPLRAIDNLALKQWKERLQTTPLPPPRHWSAAKKATWVPRPPSRTTVAKYLREIIAILSTCGPARHGKPDALGVLAIVPCTAPPPVDEGDVVYAEPEEVSAIYRACDAATWPKGPGPRQTWPAELMTAADWWRALLVYLFNIGSRKNEFLRLRWDTVDMSRRLLTPPTSKRQKACLRPINATLFDHLFSIWQPARELVFACPDSKTLLYSQFHTIQRAAGISVPRPAGSRRLPVFGFHELRKTCGTVLTELNPRAAQAMLGHASIETTMRSYSNARRSLLKAAHALEQPAAFAQATGTDPLPPPAPSSPEARPRLRLFSD